METLALAMKLADLAEDAQQSDEHLDVRREAKRLVRDHPEAEMGVEDVAEALEEEAAKPDAL